MLKSRDSAEQEEAQRYFDHLRKGVFNFHHSMMKNKYDEDESEDKWEEQKEAQIGKNLFR